jgi:transcriptional regulator with XRE-family HTH domain
MIIGERLKALREQKKISQGEIEKRTGLLRCYISRVENGHTVPSVTTLEKMARALEVPMYRLFTDDENVKKPDIPRNSARSHAAISTEERDLRVFAKLLSQMDDKDRRTLLHMASKMAKRA